MKKFKWQIIALLSVLLIVLAGCGDSEETPKKEDDDKGAAESDSGGEESDGDNGQLASKDPLELSIHLHYADRVIFDDNWLVFKEAADLTNISLKGTASSNASDSREVFSLMMAGNKIPDIVHTEKDDFAEYGQEGAFLSLDELIEEHAPNIKNFLEERSDVRKHATAPDGNLYYIPYVPDGDAAAGWFIRQDWLDKLGLDAPETVEDYYDVLTAFKTQDPNGNGKEDEVPLFTRNFKALYDMFILWNAHSAFYLDGDDVKFGPSENEYEDALSNMAKWYKEGLIDKEVFTRGADSREILLGDDVGGSTHDWFASTANYNELLKDKVEGIHFAPFAPPENTNGERIEITSRPKSGNNLGWGISHTNPDPVATMKYFDFWFSEEGRRLANFGVEGETYTMEDGKPVFKAEVIESANVPVYLNEYGSQIEFGFHQDFAYEEQWMNPTSLEGVKEYMENGYFADPFPSLTFTAEEQKTLDNAYPAIDTYLTETIQKWVLGAEAVEGNFEKFQQRLVDMNIDKVLEVYQAAYDRLQAQ